VYIGLYICHVNEDTLWLNDDDPTEQHLRSFRTVHEKVEFCVHRKSMFNLAICITIVGRRSC